MTNHVKLLIWRPIGQRAVGYDYYQSGKRWGMMTNHAEFSEATNQAWNMTTNQAECRDMMITNQGKFCIWRPIKKRLEKNWP